MATDVPDRDERGGPAVHWWTSERPFGIPRFIVLLLAIPLALGLVYLAAAFVRPGGSVPNVINLKSEGNAPTWFASIQWFTASALLFAIADLRFSRSDLRSWALWVPPALCLGFSIDEVVQLHERAGSLTDNFLPGGSRMESLFGETGVWFITIGAPLIALVVVTGFLIRPYLASPGDAFRLLSVGTVAFLLGSLGLEGVSNFLVRDSALWTLGVALEETAEMVGATLVVWGSYMLVSWRPNATRPIGRPA
jgi:hypothetical protein